MSERKLDERWRSNLSLLVTRWTNRNRRFNPSIFSRRLWTALPAAIGLFLCMTGSGECAGSAEDGVSTKPEEPVVQMDKMVVTGSRTPTSEPQRLPVPVQVVTREQLQQIGAVSLGQALEVIQSVELIQSPDLNAAPGVQTLRMRGMDANHVLVLINGRRQPGTRPDNQGFSFTDISTINIGNVERIEILRDGASAQYGSDAVAGVINIVMRKNTPRLDANSQYGLSSRGDGEEKHLSLSGSYPVSKKLYVNIDANGKQIDHYDRTPKNPRWTSPDIEQLGTSINLSYEINYRQMLDAAVRYNQSETVIRTGLIGDIPKERISKKYDQHAGLNWQGDFNPVEIECGGGLTLSDTEYRHSEDPEYNGDLESNGGDFYTHVNWHAASWLGLFAGYSFNREDVDSPQRDFDESRDINALFLEAQFDPFTRLHIALSGRVEDHSDFDVNFAPKLSGRYTLFETLDMRASVSRSYQVPTLYQLHDRFFGAMGWNDIIGNPDLEPAEGMNWNLGMVWKPFRRHGMRMSIDYYQNRIENMIETIVLQEKTTDTNAVTSYENISGTSIFEGVEWELTAPLAFGFQLDITANYLEAKDPDGKDLTNRPRSGLNATLSYRFRERFTMNLRYNYRGKYLSDKSPHEKIDPFDYLNAHASYKVASNLSVFIGARNLLDEKPPVDPEDYEGGHMESMLDSTLGAFYYGGIQLSF